MKQKKAINVNEIRKRINLSFSLKDTDEYKVILISQYQMKINKKQTLTGASLLKYLIIKGLNEINKEFGEVDLVLKKEGVMK
ncbi:hypothetical protein GCL60_09790 [Silvanigrella paludirubra]|uniref:Uncharacterized protein n=1 Tax=Silvanigrella paludirubra TaxID=2499159 RepID=A0A6N6VSP1_9BACT|nr:hypothetical protein [Silvanigrella paludirubra]KAB8039137.1 hypothetical protein GCL60_09790 [Silvanigrella paludirubra]